MTDMFFVRFYSSTITQLLKEMQPPRRLLDLGELQPLQVDKRLTSVTELPRLCTTQQEDLIHKTAFSTTLTF